MKKKLILVKDNIRKLGLLGILPYFFWPVFFLFVTFFIYKTEYAINYEIIKDETIINAYDVSEDFKDYLNNVTLIVDTASETIEDMLLQGQTTADVQVYLERKSQNLGSIVSGDTKGIYGYVQGVYVDGDAWVPDEGYVPTERVWYKKAVEAGGTKVMIDPYIDARTGKTVVTASKLLLDKRSVLAIDIWLSRLQKMTEDVGQADKDHYVMILDQNGNVIAHSDPSEVSLNYKDSDDAQKRNIYESWKNCGGEVFELKMDGVDYLLCPKNISDSWTVITVTSAEPAMKEIRRLTRSVMISAAIGLLITFLVLAGISAQKIKILNYGESIQSIANIYKTMHKFDLETGDFEKITCKEGRVSEILGNSKTEAQKMLKNVMDKVCDKRSREEVLEFVEFSTLEERMGQSDSISIEFLNFEHVWYRGRFIVAERKPDGKLKSMIWAVENIDKEKRSRDKLRYLAEIDQMTKVYNRGSGEDKVRKLLKNGEGGMFVLFDVDRFKSINDTYGHGVGDMVLIEIGKCMRRTFRDKDIVLRLGGDEFAAFTPSVCSQEEGRPVIERLISSIKKISIPELEDRKIDISIGAAFYLPEDTYAFDELYKQADSCTYLSKKKDGSCVTFYDRTKNA